METREKIEFRDLADFCEKWPQIRKSFSDENLKEHIDDLQMQEIILWLYRLADKVCTDSI